MLSLVCSPASTASNLICRMPTTSSPVRTSAVQRQPISTDSDADRTTGRTGSYTLIANQTDNSVDAGMMLRASLGDFVWNDVNGNGIQDSGEIGVLNVTVTLRDGIGAFVDDPNQAGIQNYIVQTDAAGAYQLHQPRTG